MKASRKNFADLPDAGWPITNLEKYNAFLEAFMKLQKKECGGDLNVTLAYLKGLIVGIFFHSEGIEEDWARSLDLFTLELKQQFEFELFIKSGRNPDEW